MTSTVRYHWIMTAEGRGRRATADGSIELAPGARRSAAYTWARKAMAKQMDAADIVVLFFDLQPETLP